MNEHMNMGLKMLRTLQKNKSLSKTQRSVVSKAIQAIEVGHQLDQDTIMRLREFKEQAEERVIILE